MKDKAINIRIDTETYTKLKKLADQDQRTLSNYIRLVLTNHLNKV